MNKMTKPKLSETEQENTFYSEISELLKQARNVAYRAVNTVMIQTYWHIGKQLFASKYKTILPTENELAEMISREKQKLLEKQ
jgi:hypothetical protein